MSQQVCRELLAACELALSGFRVLASDIHRETWSRNGVRLVAPVRNGVPAFQIDERLESAIAHAKRELARRDPVTLRIYPENERA